MDSDEALKKIIVVIEYRKRSVVVVTVLDRMIRDNFSAEATFLLRSR